MYQRISIANPKIRENIIYALLRKNDLSKKISITFFKLVTIVLELSAHTNNAMFCQITVK